jgi:hypothetical protein
MLWLGYAHVANSLEDRLKGYAYCLAAAEGLAEVSSNGSLLPDGSLNSTYVRKLGAAISEIATDVGSDLSPEQLAQAQSLKDSILANTPCCLVIRLPR